MATFSVHGAPSEYILQEGALNLLEPKFIERGIKKVLFVHGRRSWEAAKSYVPEFHEVRVEKHQYGGECSLPEIDTLADMVREQEYDAVVGIGGGKVLDLVKSVCHKTRRQAVLVPTLASNCSPWTPLSVLYDAAGAFVGYEIYPVSASLVLVEPRILLHAPIDMLVAGIGDTLAKWYEADVQMAVIPNKPVPLQISHDAARKCLDLLLQHSAEAIRAAKSGQLNEAFITVTETIIMLGGMVGGYGDQYGRIAGAHSIHNGLTILEDTHHALHGEKVAYGILVQLVLENKRDEIERLIPFYREIGLPVSLRELGVRHFSREMLDQVALKSTVPAESIHVMPIGLITADRVSRAMVELEQMS